MQIHEIRAIFGEILRGYSIIYIDDQTLFVKHLNQLTYADIDSHYTRFLEDAKKRGIPTEKERYDILIKTGQWTEEKDREIRDITSMIEGMEATKKKMFLEAQLDDINRNIRRERANLITKRGKKDSLLGVIAEGVAARKINHLHLFNSLFSDKNCQIPFLAQEDFENLSDKEYSQIERSVNDKLDLFRVSHVKHVALSPIVQNLYGLCSERPYDFFAKPIVELTVYQEDLVRWCRHFHFIFQQHDNIPAEVRDDPDALYEWHISGQNLKEMAQKDGRATNIVGISKKDREKLGIHDSNDKLSILINAAKNKGGASFEDAMKIDKK